MSMFNLKTAALAIVAGVGLSGCAYGPYGGLGVGVGYGNGYNDPYYNNGGYYSGGYGGGYGYPYGSGYGYGYPYGSGYGYPYGYGSSYYGWNNGYYYPGTGYYVYDRNRQAHRWSDAQRRYWERQRTVATSSGGVSRVIENWADFQNGPQATTTVNRTIRQRDFERPQRIIRERPVASSPQVRTEQQVQSSVRQEQREARAEARNEARQERRGTRGQNRRADKD
jgi:hypothetical protein